jgi:hypothetical protein
MWLAVVVVSLLSAPAHARTGRHSDPFQFCRVVVNADNDGDEGMRDPRYVGRQPPPVLMSMVRENFWWRCMDGKVFVCLTGATGRGCMRFSLNTGATASIRRYCANNPGGFVPNAVNDTPYSWNCRSRTPVMDRSAGLPGLDRRGYYLENWRSVGR